MRLKILTLLSLFLLVISIGGASAVTVTPPQLNTSGYVTLKNTGSSTITVTTSFVKFTGNSIINFPDAPLSVSPSTELQLGPGATQRYLITVNDPSQLSGVKFTTRSVTGAGTGIATSLIVKCGSNTTVQTTNVTTNKHVDNSPWLPVALVVIVIVGIGVGYVVRRRRN